MPGDFPAIQAAHDAATSGDTILVAPGTYVGQLTITKAITLTSHFLMSGNENFIANTILDGGGGAFVIEIPAGAEDRPTIQGFTIQHGVDGIWPFAMFNLLHCLVRQTSDGVDYETGSGGLVRFSTFELNSDDGIDLDHDVDIVIMDNVIRDNGDDGIEIRMQNFAGPTKNYIITRNEIYGNAQDGIQLIHYNVVTARFFEISHNFIHDNGLAGLGMMDGAVSNEDFRAASIPEIIYVFNNTFANNNHGISGGDSTVVLNNIFVGHSAIAVKNVDANSELAFNLFFDNGTNITGSNVDEGSSVFDDPAFAEGFELLAASPAIDAGTAFYVWQGTTVLDLPPSAFSGQAPDIGGFEFETDDGLPPEPPTLGSPPDGARNVGITPILTWRGDGAIYTVQMAADVGFVERIVSATLSGRKYRIEVGALDHVSTYFWRVSASNSKGTSDFSQVRSFTTEAPNAPPSAPLLLTPTNHAKTVRLDATFGWAGTAGSFDIEVTTDAGFVSLQYLVNVSSTQVVLPRGVLAYGTEYYWRVRGNNALGVGNFSAPFAFTTSGPPDVVPPSQPQNLASPAQTNTTVDLLWDASTDDVGVSFYNIYRDGSMIASESSTSHTAVGLAPGATYGFQVSALDAAGNESPPSSVLSVPTLAMSDPVSVDAPIGTSEDDAEERASGSVNLVSGDLELVFDAGGNQTVGLRFGAVDVPRQATILDAYIQFHADRANTLSTSLTLRGEQADHAAAFVQSTFDITSRVLTLAAESWSPPPWKARGDAGPDQRTTDIASIVQEIVDRPGWSNGNALVVIIEGTGERTATSYDGGASAAATLHVDYQTAAPAGTVVDRSLMKSADNPRWMSVPGSLSR